MSSFKEGLEDVVVSTSEICFIDGREGRLLYRGYDVDDLVRSSSFEEVVYLLWHGNLPSRKDLDAHIKALSSVANRKLPPKLIAILRQLPKKTAPMEVLRTGVSALQAFDPDAEDNAREATVRKAVRLTAQMPTLVAAWERLRQRAGDADGRADQAPGPGGGVDPQGAGRQGAHHGLRPPRLSRRGPAGQAPAAAGHGARAADRQPSLRGDPQHGRPRRHRGEEDLPERRPLLGRRLRVHGHSHRPVHADLRPQPGRRLVRARARAAHAQSAHPPARRVHRPYQREVRAHRSAVAAVVLSLSPIRTQSDPAL